MKVKSIVLSVVLAAVVGTTAFAAKSTYIATNHRFNYVKLKEIKGRTAEARMMTHPVKLNVDGVRAALKSINLAKSYVTKKEVDTQQVFSEYAINFLAPNMVKAFAQATPMEVVVISYMNKNPIFILRNDRINISTCYIHENELHIKFQKLCAKVTGDIDKRGNEGRAVSRARGLRVKLELGPGQKMSINDPEEIVLDLNYNYVVKPEKKKEVKKGVTMTGEVVPLPPAADSGTMDEADFKQMEHGSKMKTKKGEAKSAPAPESGSIKERLRKLDELKKEGLISNKEYKAKKKEILKEL